MSGFQPEEKIFGSFGGLTTEKIVVVVVYKMANFFGLLYMIQH